MKTYIDISHHHAVTNWGTLKKNCPFLISKATQGTSFVDGALDSFINGCETNKIPYWLYTYLNKGNELEQAKFLVSICKGKVGKYFRGYVLDVEAGNAAENVKAALDYIAGLGGKCMIYTMYSDYSKYRSIIDSRPSACAWWEARYGKNDGTYNSNYPCHSGVDLHQYTDQGSAAGVYGKIDLNRLTGTQSESWFTGEGEPDVGYDLQTNYPNVAYRDKQGKPIGATIASGGCCPTSVGNVLRNLCGISDATTRNVCALATSCGARYNGGTTPSTLLEAALKKWGGFTYEYTTSDAKMKDHVAAGGMAIAHTPGSNGGATALFSTGGHFVAMIGISGSKMKVCDPYWYSGKWTANNTRKSNIAVTLEKGIVQANYAAVAAACDYYYLISKKVPTVITPAKVNARSGAGVTKKKLGTIDKGAKLVKLAQTPKWVKVGVWISRKYCKITNGKATTKAPLNARASNSIKADRVGSIRKGATLTVLETTNNWVRVPVWIARKYTK